MKLLTTYILLIEYSNDDRTTNNFRLLLYLAHTIFVIGITCYKICILNYKTIGELFEYEIKLYLAQLINNNVMMINPNQKVAVITGSSSGIGLETSLTLA